MQPKVERLNRIEEIDLSREADFVLGALRISPSTRSIHLLSQAETIEPRVMQVLVCLHRATGTVVSRDDLIECCWGGQVVGDDAINRCIAKVRRLSELTPQPSFEIETIPRVGYRLKRLTNDSLVTSVLGRRSARDKIALAIMLGAIVVLMAAGFAAWFWSDPKMRAAPRLSVLVLPFANTSGDPAQEYVADAITDDVTIELSRIKGSIVIGRGTAFSYKGKTINIKEVANDLDVRYVLQGTVARTETKFHVTAQLIDGNTETNIWADSLDVDRSSVEDIRVVLVSHLANNLNVQLIRAEAKRSEKKTHPDAIDFVMKARSINQYADEKLYYQKLQLIEQALSIDPDYELAFAYRASMAISLLSRQKYRNDADQLLANAQRDASRAIELDPTDPLAFYALAFVRRYQGRLGDAIIAASRAIELNPNYAAAIGLRARIYVEAGQSRKALADLDTALHISPRDPDAGSILWGKCYANIHLGQFNDALPLCEQIWGQYQYWYNAYGLLTVYSALGEHEKAEMVKDKLLKIVPDFSITRLRHFIKSGNDKFQKENEEYVFPYLRQAGIPE